MNMPLSPSAGVSVQDACEVRDAVEEVMEGLSRRQRKKFQTSLYLTGLQVLMGEERMQGLSNEVDCRRLRMRVRLQEHLGDLMTQGKQTQKGVPYHRPAAPSRRWGIAEGLPKVT